MKILLTITPLILLFHSSNSQSIQPLEPVSGYYKAFQEMDAIPNSERAALEDISFPDGKASGRQFIGIEPTYLQQSDYSTLKKLVSFPANSSDQTRAELDYLLNWQDKRTKSNRSRAYEIAMIGYWPSLEKDGEYGNVEELFWECQSIVGSSCSPDNYPATVKLLSGVTRDVRIAEFTLKFHHMRPRPYHLEPKLDPMGRVSNPSFASGHTLWAYIQAFTWSELMPNRRQEYLDLAFEVGESREIMGIHYPSDEEAARIISHKMLTLMLKNEEFLADLNSAKAEWD